MQEFWFGDRLMTFDGTIVEAFGFSDTIRYHVYHIRAFMVTRKSFGVQAEGRSTPLCPLRTPEDHEAARALVAAVNSARAERGWSPVSAG